MAALDPRVSDDRLLQTIARVRAKHAPHFAELEAAIRSRHPHLNEIEAAIVAVALLDAVGDSELASLQTANPGMDRVQ